MEQRVSMWSHCQWERLSRATMKGREMNSAKQEKSSLRAQLLSAESQQGENHFSFRFNILSAQTRTVVVFFCLIGFQFVIV